MVLLIYNQLEQLSMQYKTVQQKMKRQPSQQLTKNRLFYLNYTFTLSDLEGLVLPYQSFLQENRSIQINLDQNFTFQTQQYAFKFSLKPENQLRIIYYALLQNIFSTNQSEIKDKIQQTFERIVLCSFDIILPFKQTVKKDQKNIATIMTTNQIKSSFVKFLSLLKSSNQKSKIILKSIIKLPQIDFVLMSIFQMYFSKNYQTLKQKLEKISKDFDLKTQVLLNGFRMGEYEYEIHNKKQDEFQTILVKKNQPQKKDTNEINLKRTGTSESIGEMEQENLCTTQEQANQGLTFQQLINARFVESCSSNYFQNLQNEEIVKVSCEEIQTIQTVQKFIFLKQNTNTVHNLSPQVIKPAQRQKKTTFLNQNIHPKYFIKSPRVQRNNQKIKTFTESQFKNIQINKQKPRPFSQKHILSSKEIGLRVQAKNDQMQSFSKRTLSTSQSKKFLSFSKAKLNDSDTLKRISARKSSQKPKIFEEPSNKFFFSSVRT